MPCICRKVKFANLKARVSQFLTRHVRNLPPSSNEILFYISHWLSYVTRRSFFKVDLLEEFEIATYFHRITFWPVIPPLVRHRIQVSTFASGKICKTNRRTTVFGESFRSLPKFFPREMQKLAKNISVRRLTKQPRKWNRRAPKSLRYVSSDANGNERYVRFSSIEKSDDPIVSYLTTLACCSCLSSSG